MTGARRVLGRGVQLVFLVAAFAGAAVEGREDPTPELNAERDALIEKIIRGEDFEASVRRLAELVHRRDEVIATSRAAKEELAKERRERAAWQEAYRKTVDHEATWRCVLSVDPANPVRAEGYSGNFPADWGRVVRKETVMLPPKNPLDTGEAATMYEVEGKRRRYYIRGERYGFPDRKNFEAEVGALVFVCDGGAAKEARLPAGWSEPIQRSGFAARIAEPPRIVKKGKWNPLHITSNFFFWAIREVKWRLPPELPVLSSVEVRKDLGGGRYEIDTQQDKTWVLEVPPGVKGRELLVPGHSAWVIMGKPHFDLELKKLVLSAEDIEERYVPEQ